MSLQQHLATGATTVCRCWGIFRADDQFQGFTDHDLSISFEGLNFEATSGMTPHAIEQSTGLAVDNTSAIGVIASGAINELDLKLGRYDGATVKIWRVNWADPEERSLDFVGTIGEIKVSGQKFEAELRGQTERLNLPIGRIYQRQCDAVVGDAACGVELTDPRFFAAGTVVEQLDASVFVVSGAAGHSDGWFARGVLRVGSGDGVGVRRTVKSDSFDERGNRIIEVWETLPITLEAGTSVMLTAGCDRRWQTCASKFDNLLNFRGFPDIPGEDWLARVPRTVDENSGGSRR